MRRNTRLFELADTCPAADGTTPGRQYAKEVVSSNATRFPKVRQVLNFVDMALTSRYVVCARDIYGMWWVVAEA